MTQTRSRHGIFGCRRRGAPKALSDPPPRMPFEGFGENALTLNMRTYLDDMNSRIPTITEPHHGILDKFREADIVFAFPQRDLHLDTSRPLKLVLREDALTKRG